MRASYYRNVYDHHNEYYSRDEMYIDRYQRMSRYGPYDDEARYPHDYYEKQHQGYRTYDHHRDYHQERRYVRQP